MIRSYNGLAKEQAVVASILYKIDGTIQAMKTCDAGPVENIEQLYKSYEAKLTADNKQLLQSWPLVKERYSRAVFEYKVRDKLSSCRSPQLP